MGAGDLGAFERDRQRLLVAGQCLERAAFVDRGARDVDPRLRLERELTRAVELGESVVHPPDAGEDRPEGVVRVTLDDRLADRLRHRDRLLAHGHRLVVATREHQLLAEGGEHLRPRRAGLDRHEAHGLAAMLEDVGPRSREHPEVPAEALVQQPGNDRIVDGIDLGDGRSGVVEGSVGAPGHLRLRRRVAHHVDVAHAGARLGVGNLRPQREDPLGVVEGIAVRIDLLGGASCVERGDERARRIACAVPVAGQLGQELRRAAVEPDRVLGEHLRDACAMQRDRRGAGRPRRPRARARAETGIPGRRRR